MIEEVTSDDKRDADLVYKLLMYGLSYDSMNDIYDCIHEHITVKKKIILLRVIRVSWLVVVFLHVEQKQPCVQYVKDCDYLMYFYVHFLKMPFR